MQSADVPQATLDRVARAVRAIAAGARTARDVADLTASQPRHVSYGLAAARTLNLLTGTVAPLKLTPLGREMAGTPEASQQERDALRLAVSQSEILQQIAPGLLGRQPPSLGAIASNIRRLAGMSAGTAEHRARMISNWRKILLQTSMLGELDQTAMKGMWRASNSKTIAASST